MNSPKMRLPFISKVVVAAGVIIFLFPSLVFLVGNLISAAIPPHISFLSRMLMSVLGLAVCLVGVIPALILYYRAE